MTKRLILAVGGFALLGAAAGSAVTPVPAKITRTSALPAGVKVRSDLKFTSIGLRTALSAVSTANRLPFSCMQDWDTFWKKGRVFIWYKGTNAVQTQKLRVHWSLQGCCDHTVGAPTSAYMLYPNEGFYVYDGVPANLTLPPEGQPLLTCTAYGWLVP